MILRDDATDDGSYSIRNAIDRTLDDFLGIVGSAVLRNALDCVVCHGAAHRHSKRAFQIYVDVLGDKAFPLGR